MSANRLSLAHLLDILDATVIALPATLPESSKDGPLYSHFSSYVRIPNEGAYLAFNQRWEQVFQISEEEKLSLVSRGPYGIGLAVEFIRKALQAEGIDDALDLLELRASELLELIRKV